MLIYSNFFTQSDININNNWSMTKAHKLPSNSINDWSFNKKNEYKPQNLIEPKLKDSAEQITSSCQQDCINTKSGINVNIGRNFEGNNLTNGTPPDNSLAISNDGKIVSVDNYSIAYFKETGDTIVKFSLPWDNFYSGDSTLAYGKIFDPKVDYDRYKNRFFLVSMFHSNDYSDSRILISFSKPLNNDSIEWNGITIK